MSKMFGGDTKFNPPPIKKVRQPTIADPSVEAAAERTKMAAMDRKGRMSTMLTDQTQAVAGSSGQKLGA